ncbi:protein kinase [Nocardia sp. NBC_00881]|uniref:protein kinase domain-containing protein n=1 Tax=Nocardia sp. NBC_00881 TaxID=2975995 RepID=UPI00386F454B|nr:protein kinase [Nocardia sp. NBC_00881]
MGSHDLEGTQRDVGSGVAAELAAAGFDGAREIGRGGFGVVYRCVEHSLDRAVAVKVLDSEVTEQDRARFLREQRALGRFSAHPHVVQVLRADVTTTGKPYLVMPFHAQGSLQSRVRVKGPLPWQEVLSVGVKIAGALAAAHTRGIVHRDVNPANILMTDYGEPQLADFGIARVGGGFQTAAGLVAGTPAFTAPEVLRGGEPTVAADIYSLGATLFCLLTGHAAFERRRGESVVAQFVRVTTEPVPDLRRGGVPALLCVAVESAMAGDPAQRPATAREFGDRLRNIEFSSGVAVNSMVLAASDVTGGCEIGVEPAPTPAPPLSVQTALVTPSTRYRPPEPSRQPVARRRLLDILRRGRSQRLVLIHGPAGFGKSTLAAQWIDSLACDGVRVAWLSVDLDDNNVVWFLSHVIEAIRRAHPAVATDLAQILEERSSDAAQHVMATLIDEIHHRGEAVALVVDDWHRVSSPVTVAAMEFLLDRGCHHLQMIVTSRSRKGLPLSRMLVRDELVEIDAAGLRFDDVETAAFVAGVNDLSLAAEEIAHLRASTEGWAAAVQLASLSLRGREDPGAYLSQISGRHYAIGEYLMENVIDTLEPGMLEFVMRTSVPERICGGLAEALAGVTGGQVLLEEVRARDLFLRALDDELRWFRYHALFADFLRRRLIQQYPGLLEELHSTACEWFADHAMVTEAVDHALAANAPDRAMELVDAHAEALLEDSRMATLLGLVAKLPDSLTAQNPKLQVKIAWANIALQRLDVATTVLDRADAALAEAPADDDQSNETRIESALARTCAALVVDQPVRVPESVLVRAREPLRPYMAQAVAMMAMGTALHRFEFDEVYRWHRWFEPYRNRGRGPFAVMYCDCIAGVAASEQLGLASAESYFRTALSLALQTGRQSYSTRLASALLGELLYEKGQFIEAEELLDIGLAVEGGGVEFLLAAYGTGARLAGVRGDLDTARQRLDEGAAIAAIAPIPRLAARMVNERIRLGLPIADTDRRDLEQLAPYTRQPNAASAITAELAHDSAIRLLLAERTSVAAELACRRAEQLVREIAGQNRPRALLHAELLRGCCLSATGHTRRAAELLAPVLSRCAEQRLLRVVVDTGHQLQPVIETCYNTTKSDTPLRHFLRQIMAEFEQVPLSCGQAENEPSQ